MTIKSRQKLKYLENEKSFYGEINKAFFIIFKGLSVAKKSSQTLECAFKFNFEINTNINVNSKVSYATSITPQEISYCQKICVYIMDY